MSSSCVAWSGGSSECSSTTAADGPALVCRGIDVAYDKVQVLFGVDLDVERNEIVALLGTNGAGKSTLLKAISGLVDPKAGKIWLAMPGLTVKPMDILPSCLAAARTASQPA